MELAIKTFLEIMEKYGGYGIFLFLFIFTVGVLVRLLIRDRDKRDETIAKQVVVIERANTVIHELGKRIKSLEEKIDPILQRVTMREEEDRLKRVIQDQIKRNRDDDTQNY